MSQWGIAEGRIRRIEQDQNRKKSYTHFTQYDGQRVRVSCPPDKILHVAGGWLMSDYGKHFNTLAKDCDFGLGGSTEIAAFTNADYYIGCIMLRCYCYNGTTLEWGHLINRYYTDETATYVCAEQLTDYLARSTLRRAYGFPLCAVIFKNDGTTGIAGSILPIDAVNRGRSYLWRDVRPFMFASGQTTSVPTPSAPCT